MSRRGADRVTASVLVAALLVGGCGTPRSGALGPAPTAAPSSAAPSSTATSSATPTERADPTPSADPPRSPTTTPPAPARTTTRDTVTIELWFVRAGQLVPTRRARPATVATSRLALTELAAGPTPAEAATGLTTLVPAGVEVTRITDGMATLRVPSADGPVQRRLREAQVVWTLTQFPTVRQVRVEDAAPVDRTDYADLLPPIVVTGPIPGERVWAPLVVTGTATVFEATVSVRVLDAAGREVAAGFGTASCGSGCRGGYRVVVGWHTAREQKGTVEVYEVSARDGSRINTMAVPVVLAPGG
ncbi:Gmad2 immunoglobulin-like domain-containing protein [Micromonospora sp. NBC_01638]|uniref:Gmad2 immunoglobulin-like domain-containing protein n=1 Tax=Micromonospora sp. NBC_01638 TaxID=2975982 RepID=UPI003867A3B1|nr:GerMN domain-containing protein [Micromonospora sp. NBC_01638]